MHWHIPRLVKVLDLHVWLVFIRLVENKLVAEHIWVAVQVEKNEQRAGTTGAITAAANVAACGGNRSVYFTSTELSQ